MPVPEFAGSEEGPVTYFWLIIFCFNTVNCGPVIATSKINFNYGALLLLAASICLTMLKRSAFYNCIKFYQQSNLG